MENITKSLDEDEYTIAVLIDLTKAFDTINHSILLKKKLFKLLWYTRLSVKLG